MRAAILSTQELHLQQARNLSVPDARKISKWEGLSDAEMAQFSREAFQTVCGFKAVTSVKQDSESLATDLETWWQLSGKNLVGASLSILKRPGSCLSLWVV